MSTTEQPASPPARRPGPRKLQVIRATEITPHLKRITLGGEDLEGFPANHEGAHIKVFLQRPGQEALQLPTLGPDGPVWPPKEQRPFVRTYTVRRYNAAASELDVDFVIHGDNGPASAWAMAAQSGDEIGIAGPEGREDDLFAADWVVITGDLSALPAISAYLETLPASVRGHAFIEIPDASEEQQIITQSQIALTWLHQNGVESGWSTLLLDAVGALEWPTRGRVFAFLAGESSTVVAIRNFLRESRGVERDAMYTVPYWKAGLDEDGYHADRHRIMDDKA